MPEEENKPLKRLKDYVESSWKMILILGAIIGSVVTVSRTWDKIDSNEKKWQQIDDKYNNMIKEMIKDNKKELDDQHELILNQIRRLSELKEQMNNHEISAAEFRGRVKATLKIQ